MVRVCLRYFNELSSGEAIGNFAVVGLIALSHNTSLFPALFLTLSRIIGTDLLRQTQDPSLLRTYLWHYKVHLLPVACCLLTTEKGFLRQLLTFGD